MKSVILLSLISVVAQASLGGGSRGPQPNYQGFSCQYVSASKKQIDITGFSHEVEKLPKKFESLIEPGQIVMQQESGDSKVFNFIEFLVGRSGFAGRNVLIEAYGSFGNGQDKQQVELKIDFVTGADRGQTNAKLTIMGRSSKPLESGFATCRLLTLRDLEKYDDSGF